MTEGDSRKRDLLQASLLRPLCSIVVDREGTVVATDDRALQVCYRESKPEDFVGHSANAVARLSGGLGWNSPATKVITGELRVRNDDWMPVTIEMVPVYGIRAEPVSLLTFCKCPDEIPAPVSAHILSLQADAIMRDIPVILSAVNEDRRVALWNHEAERVLGWTKEDLLGSTLNLLYPDVSDRHQLEDFMFERSPAHRSDLELKTFCKDGTIRIICWKQITREHGWMNHCCAGFDVTELRQQNEDLIQRALEAHLAVKVKSEFLATMSHEIRTPMNAIIGMTGLLLETPLSSEQRDYLETVRGSADALLQLINDVLDFSKIEAGKMTLENSAFNFHVAVEDVLDLLAEQAQTKNLELILLPDPQLPKAIVGDPGRVRQVLTNIVGNAIKFTDKGEIVVRVAVSHLSETEVDIQCEVEDTGIGMDSATQQQMFQAFTQGDRSHTRKYGGTGLGLAICKQLVEAMGGNVSISSAGVNRGTKCSFKIRFSLSKVVEDTETSLMEAALMHRDHPLRVLIADSSDTAVRGLRLRLEMLNCRVQGEHSGAQILQHLKIAVTDQRPFDVVIVATVLAEGLTGLETLCAVKSAHPNVATLLMRNLHDDPVSMNCPGTLLCKPLRNRSLVAGLIEELHVFLPEQQDSMPRITVSKVTPLRILLAEDNVINQRVTVLGLRKLGHVVDAVGNGREAVLQLAQIPYDVVLMDCRMPEMDGFDATRHIRRLKGAAGSIPIIALTASAQPSDRAECIAAGMNDWLPKPFTSAKLQEMIDRVARPNALKENPSIEKADHLVHPSNDPLSLPTVSLSSPLPTHSPLPSVSLPLPSPPHKSSTCVALANLPPLPTVAYGQPLPKMARSPFVVPRVINQNSPRGSTDHPRILLIDDTKTNLVIFTRMLEKLGFSVEAVSDGRVATAMYAAAPESHPFSSVFVDLHMPGLDGYATAKQIRHLQEVTGKVPIALVTADSCSGHCCSDALCVDYCLHKPFTLLQLQSLLQKMIPVAK